MSLVESLKKAQIFSDLAQAELEKIAALGYERSFGKGDTDPERRRKEPRAIHHWSKAWSRYRSPQRDTSTPLVNLGTGQIFGEMSLVDRGARSATVTAASDAVLQVIPHEAFLQLCEKDNHIGFIVMRNLAAEMSLRLRYHNIARSMDAME